MAYDYSIEVSGDTAWARRWLLLGVVALAVAGLYALLLGTARSPAFAHWQALKDLFHVTLVVHVNLSVLVWFLAAAAMLWSLESARPVIPYARRAAFGSFAAGTLLLMLSPLAGGQPLMSNYIPVLTNAVFFAGLGLLFSAVALQLLFYFTAETAAPRLPWRAALDDASAAQHFGLGSAAAIAALALLCFVLSHRGMPYGPEAGVAYYDLLFWGGGHVLQFTHTQLVMVVWLWLGSAVGGRLAIRPLAVWIAYATGLLGAAAGLAGYLAWPVNDETHRQFFTDLMSGANGIGPLAIGVLVLRALWLRRTVKVEHPALLAALIASLVLFLYGGALGWLIRGSNVTIPAHYHGAIVGVTLAFMGIAYLLLPRFGFADVSRMRLAVWQPALYAGGQALHITGLAISGGYGVLRKTPGTEGFSAGAKAAMGLMGIGQLLAVIGGFLFVVVVARALWSRKA